MLQMVLDKVTLIDKKVDGGFKEVSKRFDETDKRINKLGIQLAELEDDAPTMEEHEDLERRVKKVEHQIASI